MASKEPILRLAVLVLVASLGCVSSGPRPGTGDLSFRLLWNGSADLDLHVEDPHGHHIGVVLPHDVAEDRADRDAETSPRPETDETPENRGILDVDCNAGPDRICDEPIENVYWPTGTAPPGPYRARVVLFQALHSAEEVPFVLQIREGETVVREVPGRVGDRHRVSPWISFEH